MSSLIEEEARRLNRMDPDKALEEWNKRITDAFALMEGGKARFEMALDFNARLSTKLRQMGAPFFKHGGEDDDDAA